MNRLEIEGLVVTTPRAVTTETGLQVFTCRVANKTGDQTNWLTASAFGVTATEATLFIEKGDKVFLQGRLRVRDWDNGERSGTSVEIEIDKFQVVAKRGD